MIHLTGTNPTNHRWYNIDIQPSLFGGFVVVQTWGGEAKGPSGSKRRLWPDSYTARKAVESIIRLKKEYRFGATGRN